MSSFKKGMTAFKTGSLGNPYPLDSDESRQWEAGFNKAYFENLNQVRKREQRNARKENSGAGSRGV